MLITSIEPLSKYKYSVIIDYTNKIILTQKDMDLLNLQENDEISDEQLNCIYDDILFPRAKNKALDILATSSKSCYEIKSKLMKQEYNDTMINRVIDFLMEYNLINDEQYAIDYYNYMKSKKSYKQIIFDLQKKGIDKVYLDEYIREQSIDTNLSEEEQIETLISKYRDEMGNIPDDKKNKIASKLYRKGYKSNLIYKILSIYD